MQKVNNISHEEVNVIRLLLRLSANQCQSNLDANMQKVKKISHEEVNVIRLMLRLSATQCQFVTLRDTYTKTFKDLETKVKDTEELKHKKQEL